MRPAPGPTPAPAQPDSLQQFLERRVVEELAAEGLLLGRLGYAVKISVTGSSAEIALWDTTSSRAVRATKVDGLAADREAALATVTQVVANMVAQQSQVTSEPLVTSPMTPAPGAASPPAGVILGHEEAEARFRREAIGFGDQVIVGMGPNGANSVSRGWWVWRGELRTPMSPDEFCGAIQQPQRCRDWRTHRTNSWIMIVGGAAAILLSAPVYIAGESESDFDSQGRLVETGGSAALQWSGAILFAGGMVASVVGLFRLQAPMMPEADAKNAAQKYNDDLRRKYGLPVAARSRTLTPSFRLTGAAPYVGENQAGFALTGRF